MYLMHEHYERFSSYLAIGGLENSRYVGITKGFFELGHAGSSCRGEGFRIHTYEENKNAYNRFKDLFLTQNAFFLEEPQI